MNGNNAEHNYNVDLLDMNDWASNNNDPMMQQQHNGSNNMSAQQDGVDLKIVNIMGDDQQYFLDEMGNVFDSELNRVGHNT